MVEHRLTVEAPSLELGKVEGVFIAVDLCALVRTPTVSKAAVPWRPATRTGEPCPETTLAQTRTLWRTSSR